MTTDKQPTPQELTPKQKRDAYGCLAIIAVGIVIIFGSCAYGMGYPWTCADAHNYLEESREKYRKAFNDGNSLGMTVEMRNINRAKLATQQKCPTGQREF